MTQCPKVIGFLFVLYIPFTTREWHHMEQWRMYFSTQKCRRKHKSEPVIYLSENILQPNSIKSADWDNNCEQIINHESLKSYKQE